MDVAFRLIFLTLLMAPMARAELIRQTYQHALPHQVKEITMIPNQPLRVIFNDGTVIGFKIKTQFAPLHSTILLSENSCTRKVGAKGDYTAPMITRSLIPYWLVHPSKKDLPVLQHNDADNTMFVTSTTAFYNPANDPQFAQKLQNLTTSQIDEKDLEILELAKAHPDSFGWYGCPKGRCKGLLPKAKQILYWDENFETQNAQSRMASNQEGPPTNQITARLQEIPLTSDAGRIHFGVPHRAKGIVENFAPGFTYQLQWSFLAKNLLVPDDEFCQMKWDMDFTRLFTTLTKASEDVLEIGKVTHHIYPIYNFQTEDKYTTLLGSAFDKDRWRADGIQR